MKTKRKIILIDEEKCTGCGQCIIACAEGALKLVDGKAKLVSDIYCDGLGACLGECPEGALKIIEREAEDFDEKTVEEHLKREESGHKAHSGKDAGQDDAPALPCGCPGSTAMSLAGAEAATPASPPAEAPSTLGHWPIKLQLLGPQAPFLKGADLLLMADCVGVAFPNLHGKLLRGHAVAIGCPKLDNLDAHIGRLAEILQGAKPKSLTVVHMEVPCCHGFMHAAEEAIKCSGTTLPLKRVIISRKGEIIREETAVAAA